MRLICLYLFVSLCYTLNANSLYEFAVQNYIDQFKDEAVTEMHRSGIPASIKLAQGILESDAGRSELAIKANNHFGMKCGSSWEGETFYKKDDDRDRKGRLIESCFRAYNSALESYAAHSQFLKDPKKEFRYGHLFDIELTDYRSWAWGLKQSGYATNRRYAVLLIDIIERHGLFTYDYQEPRSVVYIDPAKAISENRNSEKYTNINTLDVSNQTSIAKEQIIASTREKFKSARRKEVINDIEVIVAREGETLEELANEYNLKVRSLLKYNDQHYSAHEALKTGDKVFLGKKKKAFNGVSYYHVMRSGESLHDVSQIYGVQYKSLLNRNHLEEDVKIGVGQKIKLKGKPAELTSAEVVDISSDKNETKSTVSAEKTLAISSSSSTASPEPNKNTLLLKEEPVSALVYHYVKKGETLYSISKLHGLTVDQLKTLNELVDNTLSIDQKLLIERR